MSSHAPHIEKMPSAPSDDTPRSSRALIVEDNRHTAEFLEFMLKRAGFSVLKAGNGRDALEIIKAVEAVDVVLLDLMLPYVSGYDIISAVRESANWCDVPILVISGKVLEQDVIATLELGANDFVSKPFRPQEVLARVRRLLRSSSQREAQN